MTTRSQIINHPVPLNLNTLNALKRSPLGLDLYLWLTYRTFALRAPLWLSWRQVYRQFGAHPDNASDHRTVQGSAQNRANLYAKPFASHETAVELALAVEEDVVPPDRADMGQ